jgi:hypothetical protein
MLETMDIEPVMMPAINRGAISAFCEMHMDRNPLRAADRVNLDLDDMATFIVFLADLEKKDVDGLARLRNANGLIKHLQTGFMFRVSNLKTIYKLIRFSDLRLVLDEEAKTGFISGDMFEWVRTIIKGCTDEQSYGVRLFLNHCFLFFEKGGLRQIFELFGRDGLPDGTFTLRTK